MNMTKADAREMMICGQPKMDVDADPKKDVGIARWMDDGGNPNSIPGFPMEQGIPKIKQPQNFSFSP
jgi:hypothetical protein